MDVVFIIFIIFRVLLIIWSAGRGQFNVRVMLPRVVIVILLKDANNAYKIVISAEKWRMVKKDRTFALRAIRTRGVAKA